MDILHLFYFLEYTLSASIGSYAQILLRNKGYAHSLVGVIIAVGQIASIVFPIVVSRITDRNGKSRQLMMLSSVVAAVVAFPLCTCTSVVLTVVLFVLIQSLLWIIISSADGYAGRVTEGDSRRYSKVRASGTLGYIVTLALFSLLSFPDETSNPSIALACAITCVVFIPVLFFVPDDPVLLKNSEKTVVSENFRASKSFKQDGLGRNFHLFMLVIGVSRIANGLVDKLLGSYMTEELNLGRFFTLFIAIGGFFEFLMIRYGSRPLANGRISVLWMARLSCIGTIVRFCLCIISRNIVVFAFAQMLHAFTFGSSHLAATKYITDNIPQSRCGYAMSLYWCLYSNLPEMLGALLGGFIIEGFGYRVLFALYCLFPVMALAFSGVAGKHLSRQAA